MHFFLRCRSSATVSWQPWETKPGKNGTVSKTVGGTVGGTIEAQPWKLYKGKPAKVDERMSGSAIHFPPFFSVFFPISFCFGILYWYPVVFSCSLFSFFIYSRNIFFCSLCVLPFIRLFSLSVSYRQMRLSFIQVFLIAIQTSLNFIRTFHIFIRTLLSS